jgi:hypothetical protein
VLHAVRESARVDFAPYRVRGTSVLPGHVKGSLLQDLAGFQVAWSRFGVGRLQAFALAAGLSEQMLGPSDVEQQLEPLLQRHVERGELAPPWTRAPRRCSSCHLWCSRSSTRTRSAATPAARWTCLRS